MPLAKFFLTSLISNLIQKNIAAGTVKHWKRSTWHRKASAKNSSKLNKFLPSEVNQLIQHFIVQDQDGQNNNILKIVLLRTQSRGRGVRQGCCMSPILFNLYGEYLMMEALTEVGDFKIGGRIINKVRFADDTAIIAKTQEEL